jgi:signal transduction histidine kinase
MLGSLTNRIFLASTLLATASIGAAVFFVSARLTSEAEAELERDLIEAATLVDQQRTTLFETFTLTARLIADLPTLKAAIETADRPTVEPIAQQYRQQAGSDLFIVTDRAGAVLAAFGDEAGSAQPIAKTTSVARALRGATALAFWPHPNGVLQVVSVPVTLGLSSPEILGTLTVGFLLDHDRAVQFKALTGADIAFALGGQVRAATLDSTSYESLARLLGAGRVPRLQIGNVEYAALVKPMPLPAAAGESQPGEVPTALILRSRTDRMRTLADIQTGLGVVVVLAVLLAVVVSYAVARTVTRPLAVITNRMREVAATGDLTKKIPVSEARGLQDEDARLVATTFNTLTDSIARFQREAAQRERLSSLGRMSTVVAHEIRNPLMIIKGALRQLSRPGAPAADIREAAADINGEIERLNRVVNEVLDFAKPIRYQRIAVDVNGLCRAAAGAVTAAEAEPPVTVDLDPTVATIDSDGERLRTVLVNLLTNARQAVVAGNGQSPQPESVVLSTRRTGDRRVTISIRDSGGGISPDDLPRIFDPYFTTRRAGTGLGLPIAKNIVDALGGTMTITTNPGTGTTIRVELGDAPTPA